MNNNNKHLDNIFQKGAEEFTPSPNAAAWRKLEGRLDRHKKRSHKTIWLAAASMALVLGVSALFLLQSLQQQSPTIAQENTSWEELSPQQSSTYAHQVMEFTIKHQERLSQPVEEGEKGKKLINND